MPADIRKIEVLGPGCARCLETYRVVRHVVEQAGLSSEVVKVEDLRRMMALGIMATPAIVVDGTVVLSGRVPKTDEVRQLLGLP